MLYCYLWLWLANIEKLAKAIYSDVRTIKPVAELLSTSVATEPKVDTITLNKDETPSDLQQFWDASKQASPPKMKSVLVTVQVKGKDKGSLYIKCLAVCYI